MFGNMNVNLNLSNERVVISPHLPYTWDWRKWWDKFVECCKEMSKLGGEGIHFSSVSYCAYLKVKKFFYEIKDLEERLDRVLPTAFTLQHANNDLEMLFLVAPFITPHLDVKDNVAIVTLTPIKNFSFLLPYPIPSVVFTDDLEQLLSAPLAGVEGLGADVVTVKYRGYLREMVRQLSGGFILFMSYIVLYYATQENWMKLFTPPQEITRGTENIYDIFVEEDVLTRRLLVIAENDALPLDIRAVALGLYTHRTGKTITPLRDVRTAELMFRLHSYHLLLSSLLTGPQ